MKHARPDYDRIQDPLGKIGADEPVFLLRAQDKSSPEVVRFWADEHVRNDGSLDIAEMAERWADTMQAWQAENNVKTADLPDAAEGKVIQVGDAVQVKAGDRVTDGIFTTTLNENGATVYNALQAAGHPMRQIVGLGAKVAYAEGPRLPGRATIRAELAAAPVQHGASAVPMWTQRCTVEDKRQWNEAALNAMLGEIADLRAALASEAKADTVIDLDNASMDAMREAASHSNWMPPEYMANDWISDVCEWLRNGPPASEAKADAAPVGEVAPCDDYGVTIRWVAGMPAVGTKLYTQPPPATVSNTTSWPSCNRECMCQCPECRTEGTVSNTTAGASIGDDAGIAIFWPDFGGNRYPTEIVIQAGEAATAFIDARRAPAVGSGAAPDIDVSNICEIDRSSDQGVTVKFMSARAASQFVRELGGLLDTSLLRPTSPAAIATPTPDPDDPIERLACCIPLADHILTTVAELRSKLYGKATPPPMDPEMIIDAHRARRLERRIREEGHDPDRRLGFDRRARLDGAKS